MKRKKYIKKQENLFLFPLYEYFQKPGQTFINKD